MKKFGGQVLMFNLCCCHDQFSGKLPAFDAIGNVENCLQQHFNFKSKTVSPKLRHTMFN